MKDDEKVKFCNSGSKSGPIHLDLKMTHKKKPQVLSGATIKREEHDNEDDEKDSRSTISLDLLEAEILPNLPAKSLWKFRCVSKMWYSIIRSQRFMDSYYAVSSATRSRFIVLINNVSPNDDAKRLFIFSSSYEVEESSSLVANLEMEIPSVSSHCASKCASLHGFVGCCHGYSRQFLLCNPSTGQVVRLPCKGCRISLGYDPVDNQFKALSLLTPLYRDHQKFLVHEVLTVGRSESSSSWRRNKVSSPTYFPVTKGLCIKGFVYQGAWASKQRTDPVIVCFDVRYERLSLIKAPRDVLVWESDSIFIEYKGKLASIVMSRDAPSLSFDLWVLEDVEKHDWSKQTFELPFSLVNKMTSPGTNKAGEIIFSPKSLSRNVQPFYIFYYNVERKDIRRVVVQGIADDEEFRRSYNLTDQCFVSILPQHVESIATL